MAVLKPYRVNLGRGREAILRLTEETVARSYPDAVLVAVGPELETPEAPKTTRSRAKTTTTK